MVTYTYKLKPKARRDGYLGDLIDRHNMLWNKFVWLEEISQKRRKGQKNRHINGSTLDRYVNLHKKGHGWDYMIAGMDAQSIQATIQRREVSFDKFFKYAKAKKDGKPVAKKESPPKFKRVKGVGSFTMKQTGWRIGEGSITIGNFTKKDIHECCYWNSRPVEGKPKTVTVKRDSLGDFWLYVVTDATPFSPLPKTGKDAGFDFDSDHFFVDSHGRHWDAPRIYFKYLADLKKIDCRIARCVKGSNNQKRLYAERARLYRDIENIRDDWQRKLAWEMCRTYDVLCFENLDLADMGKRHKAREKEMSPDEKKVLRKWRRKMKDYAPGSFIEKVKWIAQKTGKRVLIDPNKYDPTSQKCHVCGFVNKAVKNLSVKKWTCPKCETKHDRDVNAAINVENICLAADEKAKSSKAEGKESKGTMGCAGGASSVDVGQSGKPARESRWARIRKPSKPQGGDAGLAEGDLHGTQTHDNGSAGGIPQASAVGGCQIWLTKRVTNMALSLAVGCATACDEEGETQFIKMRDLDLSNHFFGFTAENQEWYDRRFAELGKRPQWMQWWVSAEPLLGPIDFHFFVRDEVTGEMCIDVRKTPQLVIVGCESGPNRRPCKIEWVESIVEQCRKAGVLCFVKQLDINGVCVTDINKFPEHLRIRQLPECWAKSLREDTNGH